MKYCYLKKNDNRNIINRAAALAICVTLLLGTIAVYGISFTYGAEECSECGVIGCTTDHTETIENLPNGDYVAAATDANGEEIAIADEDIPRAGPRIAGVIVNTPANGVFLTDIILYALGAAGLLSTLFFIFFFPLKIKRDEEEAKEEDAIVTFW